MKPGAHVVLAAARLYTPFLALFACSLLAARAPGAGIGFVAGLAAGLALVLHALVFGAAAARRAAPPSLARAALALGAATALAAAGLPGLPYAPQAVEAGAVLATASAIALIALAVFGRAADLREGD